MLADARQLRRARGSRPRACPSGAGSCSGCARCPSIASSSRSSSANGALRPQVAAVGVDVLAEQRDLADAVGARGRATSATSSSSGRETSRPRVRGHDAVRALHVAADGDLHPRLELARALRRQVAGEALELEEALRGERVAREELGELVDLARAERDVDERELAEDLVLDRLRPAAADADDALRILALERASPRARWAMNRSSAFSRIEQVLKRMRSASSRSGASL